MKYTDSQGNEREIWFEYSASAVQKIELARKYKLVGFSLWRLGYEDNLFWQSVNKHSLYSMKAF